MTKHEKVRLLLLKSCNDYSKEYTWRWLPAFPPFDEMVADKFLLGAILNFTMNHKEIWDNAKMLADDILFGPHSLWNTISVMSLNELQSIFRGDCTGEGCWRCGSRHWRASKQIYKNRQIRHYSLHPHPDVASESLWNMAHIIQDCYGGSAQKIWSGKPIIEVLSCLEKMGFEPPSNMIIVEALIATGQIEGENGSETDVSAIRVFGRVYDVDIYRINKIVFEMIGSDLARSRILDERAFGLGQYVCTPNNPKCSDCCLKEECAYAQNQSDGFR